MGTCRNLAVSGVLAVLAACSGTVASATDPGATVPAAPTNVVATAGNQSVSLRWTAPVNTGGSAITGYRVVVSPPTPSASIAVNGTTATVTSLTNGTAYTFTVAAENAVGTGPASPSSAAVTPTASAGGVPGAPTNVVAVAGNQLASLSWVAPVNTGVSPITGYSIVISPPAPSATVSVNGTTATVTSLTNGTPYTFTVAAVNAVGTGPASLPSSAVTPMAPAPGVPSAPGSVTATPGVGSVSLSWTAPASGAPITGYTVTLYPPTQSAVVAVSGTTASVTGLANGATYTFTVAAVNSSGTGPASSSGPVTTPDVPGAPTNVVAVAGDQSASLNWVGPAVSGGSPVTGYSVVVNPPTPSASVAVNGTTATVTSLTDGTPYTFSVAAVNAVGTGPASLPSLPVTPEAPAPGVPTAPGSVTATAGVGSASVSWTAPSSGAPILSYTVNAVPQMPSGPLSVTGTTASVTGLANGTTYTFTVVAVNAAGPGPASLSNPITTPDLPGPPTNLVAVAGNTLASLSWTAPSSDGGSPILSYTVNAAPPIPSGPLSVTGTTASVTGLVNGTTYTFTVAAVNAVGTGPTSLPSLPVTPSMPTLAQRRAFGAMAPGRGLSPATNFTIRLPNPVGAGNCVVLLVDYSSGITVSSITDDANNSWSSVPAVSADAGSKRNKTEAYVLPNANAGAQNFTITFSAAENNVHFILLEYYNVATSGAVGVTAATTTARAPTISTSPITPVQGSLVLHYSMDNAAQIAMSGTATVTSFTAGTGWTLEAGDFASGNSSGPNSMSFFVLQTLLAPGGSVTPTVTTTGSNPVNSIALELNAASAGTPPSPGIRVLRMQDYLNTNINVSTWSEPFPSSGNLLAVMESNGDITSVISDTNANNVSNPWVLAVKGVDSDVVSLNYAKNPVTSPTLVMSWPITGTARNTTVTAYDITGADPNNPYVQSVTTGPSQISGPFTGQPIITPQRANGVVLVVCGDGIGPITALTQPVGAYYLSANYPGEVDNDTIDNADGYAIYYYGANLATQNYGWTIHSGGNSANATGVEFASPAP